MHTSEISSNQLSLSKTRLSQSLDTCGWLPLWGAEVLDFSLSLTALEPPETAECDLPSILMKSTSVPPYDSKNFQADVFVGSQLED